MTNPKSPEEVVKEFLTNFPATNDGDSKELSMYQRKVMKDFLRSSMASLLCYMAERIELPCDDEVFYDKDGNSFSNPRTILIEEAKKLTNNPL